MSKIPTPIRVNSNIVDTESRFAFVEYESRRDADDAYHEMHNKRIGRDDLLKIEVQRSRYCYADLCCGANGSNSGPELLPLHHGASILVVNASVLQLDAVLLAAVDVLLLLAVVAVVTSLPARMIAETETETMIVAIVVIVPAAQMTGENL